MTEGPITITVEEYRRGGELARLADRIMTQHGYSRNEVAEIRLTSAFVELDIVRRDDSELRRRTVRYKIKTGCVP